jgi:NAD(P)-dependent dehydrogenase (short-subunit alcohol dehydrogenase family)
MGVAVARRLGSGSAVLLADFNATALEAAADTLRGEGQNVTTQIVDVSSRASVVELGRAARGLGSVTRVAHTAGLSPAQASVDAILHVDLLGVALVLEVFADVIAVGGAGVVISSMAGHMAAPILADQESLLGLSPADDLLALPFATPKSFANGGNAYGFAKRANQLRVQAASVAWGQRGARINSISPGIISTPMGQTELDSPAGVAMRAMTTGSAVKRMGTPDDIAATVDFLLGPAATFITGTDILIDGGVTAAMRNGHIDMAALSNPSTVDSA